MTATISTRPAGRPGSAATRRALYEQRASRRRGDRARSGGGSGCGFEWRHGFPKPHSRPARTKGAGAGAVAEWEDLWWLAGPTRVSTKTSRCAQRGRYRASRCALGGRCRLAMTPFRMRAAGDVAHRRRRRGLFVILWRAGLRIEEALAFAEADLDQRRGSLLVRRAARADAREAGMDAWGRSELHLWFESDSNFSAVAGRTALGVRRWALVQPVSRRESPTGNEVEQRAAAGRYAKFRSSRRAPRRARRVDLPLRPVAWPKREAYGRPNERRG